MSRADDPDRRPHPEDELLALAPAYALGALDGFETANFERALAVSPELRAEVASFRATASALAEGVRPEAPPSTMKDGLFARLDGAPQEPRASGTGAVDELATRRSRRRLVVAISTAAAVVLVVAGVVFGVNWPGPNGWGAQRELAQLAEASDSRSATVEASDGGEVTLVWSAERGRSAIRAAGLPDVGDDRTYELWYLDDTGAAAAAGTFDVHGDANAWRLLEGSFEPGVVVGITVEPAGGSEQPTTEPIAVIPT